MAVQVIGATGTIQEVDLTMKAARVTLRPMEAQSWASLSSESGAVSALAANATVFSLRYTGPGLLYVRRMGVGFITQTAFTTAQRIGFAAYVARNFTASDTGGTTITQFGTNSGKHRSTLANPTSGDVRIATTTALTNGTRTIDANPLGLQAAWSGAAGQGIPVGLDNIFDQNSGDYPLILAPNEGIVINNFVAFGAAGTGYIYVNLEFVENLTY